MRAGCELLAKGFSTSWLCGLTSVLWRRDFPVHWWKFASAAATVLVRFGKSWSGRQRGPFHFIVPATKVGDSCFYTLGRKPHGLRERSF